MVTAAAEPRLLATGVEDRALSLRNDAEPAAEPAAESAAPTAEPAAESAAPTAPTAKTPFLSSSDPFVFNRLDLLLAAGLDDLARSLRDGAGLEDRVRSRCEFDAGGLDDLLLARPLGPGLPLRLPIARRASRDSITEADFDRSATPGSVRLSSRNFFIAASNANWLCLSSDWTSVFLRKRWYESFTMSS